MSEDIAKCVSGSWPGLGHPTAPGPLSDGRSDALEHLPCLDPWQLARLSSSNGCDRDGVHAYGLVRRALEQITAQSLAYRRKTT